MAGLSLLLLLVPGMKDFSSGPAQWDGAGSSGECSPEGAEDRSAEGRPTPAPPPAPDPRSAEAEPTWAQLPAPDHAGRDADAVGPSS